MTDTNGDGGLQGGWRLANGFTWTIAPQGMPVPNGCMQVATECGQALSAAL